MNGDNRIRNRLPHDDVAETVTDRGRQIDRLVSGDLSEADRVELLTWLDTDATRWRRCGRAFLEAQVWRETLAELHSSAVAPSAVEIPTETNRSAPARPQRSYDRNWKPALTAAVILAVFGCGWFSARWMDRKTEANSVADHRQTDGSTLEPSKEVRTAAKSPNSLVTRVVLDNRLADCEFTLPMLGSGLPAEHWARQASVPGYIKNRWGSQGYQISEQRQFVPMELADGRQVVVPINHVTLKYVGQHLL